MPMPCQHCHQAPATVHLTDVLQSGEKRERHLCEECAQKEGVILKSQEGIGSILEQFVKHGTSVQQTATETCPECGITWREFRSRGLLGCPYDYTVFQELLSPLVARAHAGATKHVGKIPGSLGQSCQKQAELQYLKQELANAIQQERYERAAELRDQIASIEKDFNEGN